jgi:hypothetical protein
MRKLNKRADINLSFGVIFSVILIAVFIFAAIYGINFFLNYSKQIQIGSFYDDFQRKVNDVKVSSFTKDEPFKISLPENIQMVCFANFSAPITNDEEEYENIGEYDITDANVFMFPKENAYEFQFKMIKGLNMERILESENPFCVSSEETLLLSKGIYENSVSVGVEEN